MRTPLNRHGWMYPQDGVWKVNTGSNIFLYRDENEARDHGWVNQVNTRTGRPVRLTLTDDSGTPLLLQGVSNTTATSKQLRWVEDTAFDKPQPSSRRLITDPKVREGIQNLKDDLRERRESRSK